jgi:hypothetical protein
VRRWNAELELRRAVETLETLENTDSQVEPDQVMLEDEVMMEECHDEAKLAVTELCKAFVNDGSRDAALAQVMCPCMLLMMMT